MSHLVPKAVLDVVLDALQGVQWSGEYGCPSCGGLEPEHYDRLYAERRERYTRGHEIDCKIQRAILMAQTAEKSEPTRLNIIAMAHGWPNWRRVVEVSQQDGYTLAGGRGKLAQVIAEEASYADKLVEMVERHAPNTVVDPPAWRTEQMPPEGPEEVGYLDGQRNAISHLLNGLMRDAMTIGVHLPDGLQAVAERFEVVTTLRRLCSRHGDNNWVDSLHLTDVIEKHLLRPMEGTLALGHAAITYLKADRDLASHLKQCAVKGCGPHDSTVECQTGFELFRARSTAYSNMSTAAFRTGAWP